MHEDEIMDNELLIDCGTPGCLMPSLHFRTECHTIEMVEDYEKETEAAPTLINGMPRPWA